MSDFFGDIREGTAGAVALGMADAGKAIGIILLTYVIVAFIVYAVIRFFQNCDDENGPEFRALASEDKEDIIKHNAAIAMLAALGLALLLAGVLVVYYFDDSPCGILLIAALSAVFIGYCLIKRKRIG